MKIFSHGRSHTADMTIKCEGCIRDLTWGTLQYKDHLAVCTDEHVNIFCIAANVVTKSIKLLFGSKIPVIRMLWSQNSPHNVHLVSGSAVHNITLSRDNNGMLVTSELTTVSTGRYGAAGVCLFPKGYRLYGSASAGACAVTLLGPHREHTRTQSIHAQSPSIAAVHSSCLKSKENDSRMTGSTAAGGAGRSDKSELFEARCVEYVTTLSLSLQEDSPDGKDTPSIMGHIFMVASEKQMALCASQRMPLSSSLSGTSPLPAALNLSRPRTGAPGGGGLISIVSSTSTTIEDPSDPSSEEQDEGKHDREPTPSGAFPHALPGTSLREALSVSSHGQETLTAPCSTSALNELHNIHAKLDCFDGGMSGHSSVPAGILTESFANGTSHDVAPHSIFSVGVLIEDDNVIRDRSQGSLPPKHIVQLPRCCCRVSGCGSIFHHGVLVGNKCYRCGLQATPGS